MAQDIVGLLEKPLPQPKRDLTGYASARVLEALVEALLALEFLSGGYTRNAAGKVFQAWRALTAALLALEKDKIANALGREEEKKWLIEVAIPRAPSTRLKPLARLLEEIAELPYYYPLTDKALSLHDYQYHGPDPSGELSKHPDREEAAHDILYLVAKLADIVEERVKPRLREMGKWTRSHEESLQRLRERLASWSRY